MLQDFDFKIPGFSIDSGYFREGQKLNIQVPADLDQFGRGNSHGTVIGGKGLVQL
jgi:hypothetical protein